MKLLKLFTFTFTLFIVNSVLFANNSKNQHTNNNKKIYFEINNKSPEYSFSATDARVLEKYLTSSNKITDCDQESLYLMLETTDGRQDIVRDLHSSGYAVLQLSCSQQTIVVTLSKTPTDLANLSTHFEKQEMLSQAKTLEKSKTLASEKDKYSNDECDDCGAVSISQDILNEFKDAYYSGQLIDFTSTESVAEQTSNVQAKENVFAVESENITCEECETSLLTEEMLDDAVSKLKKANNNELVEDALELELENSSVYRNPNK